MIKYGKEGQTPINIEEVAALIPPITTQTELNKWEQENIIDARLWVTNPRVIGRINILSEKFLKQLHYRMFNKVWKWAGEYRTTNKNIGCEYYQIPVELKTLFDDIEFWLDNQTYSIKDIAIIYHHRLVKTHLFPNGNGRHSRLVADAFCKKYKTEPIIWKNKDLQSPTSFRKSYIKALRKADIGDYKALFALLN